MGAHLPPVTQELFISSYLLRFLTSPKNARTPF
ncbi:rCG62931 [Rattus norvegicus]|uniref:RCG62931 n=1 Tax=Rattus norvegicus TaxID=10116 RepID=A6I1P7_RAT|nr:rCG62931 [Rattus norvegicus]